MPVEVGITNFYSASIHLVHIPDHAISMFGSNTKFHSFVHILILSRLRD